MIVINSTFNPNAPKGFVLQNIYYPTLQHYIDHEKPRYMTNPDDDTEWIMNSHDVLRRGVHALISAHIDVELALAMTGHKPIVYAGDEVLGCGLDVTNPGVHDMRKWMGMNMLGTVYMELRLTIANGTFQRDPIAVFKMPAFKARHTFFKKDGTVDRFEDHCHIQGKPEPEIKVIKVTRQAEYTIYHDDFTLDRVETYFYVEGQDRPIIQVSHALPKKGVSRGL